MEHKPLAGRAIAIAESRELDLLSSLFQERGADVRRYPLIAIEDHPDQSAVEAWLRRACAGEFDILIWMTGEGLRRLLSAADRLGLREAFITSLTKAVKITRGPKPAKALREIGLAPDHAATVPTSAGIADTLRQLSLDGATVGVQWYSDTPVLAVVEAITERGGKPVGVVPYQYASASDDAKVRQLLDELDAGSIHVIAFTSASQVDRLFEVARTESREAGLSASLGRIAVAAVGPIVAETLRNQGVRVDIVPERAFFMRPLVNAVVDAVGTTTG